MDEEDMVLGVFRSELSSTEAEFAEATRHAAEWTKRVAVSQASVTSLKHLISTRLAKLQAKEAEDAAAAISEGEREAEFGGQMEEAADGKTTFVLQTIQRSPGMTPAEIKKAGLTVGFDGSGNFPYTTLGKLKGRKKIREEAGKYFAN